MTLKQTLSADLQRQFDFDGTPDRKPTLPALLLRFFNLHFMPVVLYRLTHALYCRKLLPLARLVSIINFTLFGIEIAMRCEIGDGLYFAHTIGTVIGARQIGRNALIYNEVTLGAKEMNIGYDANKRPVIGDNVVIGSGAKVLGGISIGNNVIIGANAVVTHSVPDQVIVGGIPARILRNIPKNPIS
jgi:serine O-acetyltransferase